MDRSNSSWKTIVLEESFPRNPRSPEYDVRIGSGKLQKLVVLSVLLLPLLLLSLAAATAAVWIRWRRRRSRNRREQAAGNGEDQVMVVLDWTKIGNEKKRNRTTEKKKRKKTGRKASGKLMILLGKLPLKSPEFSIALTFFYIKTINLNHTNNTTPHPYFIYL